MLAWIFQTGGQASEFSGRGAWRKLRKELWAWRRGRVSFLKVMNMKRRFWDRGPKFFHYHPDDLIITSLEYDHADIYPEF